ncbi:protein phosphatase 2C domain-containing protein [Kitasatospora sp. NPDC052868]|uniref:protein phosphatase 2C domain-containing protein n=1 Tax=Kitasatospora sp. NPDC052868 TaxID=3364060 RepID=UPI0037CB546A
MAPLFNRGDDDEDLPQPAVPPPTAPPSRLSRSPREWLPAPTRGPAPTAPPTPAGHPHHHPHPQSQRHAHPHEHPHAQPPRPALPPTVGPAAPAAPPSVPAMPELWQPVVVGDPVAVFDPRPPTGLSYRPDTVCDGWSTPELDLRLASVRGYQHRYDGRPREDDAACAWDRTTGTVVFAVADGVSSARQPHIGSQLACRSAVDELLAQVRAGDGRVGDWEKLLGTVQWQLIEQARRILKQPGAGIEATAQLLATTLVAGTATPTGGGVAIEVVSVGDSGVWQIKYDRIYQLLGGKSAGPDGLVSSSVEPLPGVPTRIRPMEFYLDPGSVVLIGTDGFGDPVGNGRGEVARLFVQGLRRPVPPLGFAHLLDFSRETFDDDRTLIALWPRELPAHGRPR